MSIQLNLLKRRVAFEKNKNNLAEIYSMYWEKISTSITRQTGIVEIKLYKYSTKEIIKKFGNHFILHIKMINKEEKLIIAYAVFFFAKRLCE